MKRNITKLSCVLLLILFAASPIGMAKLGEDQAACKKEEALEARAFLRFTYDKTGLAESLALVAKEKGEVIGFSMMEELIFKNYDFDHYEMHMLKNGDCEFVHDGMIYGFYTVASTERAGVMILDRKASRLAVAGRRVTRWERP